MEKPQAEVRRECLYIVTVTLILSALMQVVFLVVGFWDYTVLLGNLWGAVIAAGNFYFLAMSVQRALGKDEKEASDILRASRSRRTFLQFLLALIGALIPAFHILAMLIPLLFPRVAIALYPYINRKRGEKLTVAEEKEGEDD
ncbi:MAG: hypothetical protein IJ009_01490 [Clostridia bacterium]|nr:hypothetical protein [Clostridia bacterium]